MNTLSPDRLIELGYVKKIKEGIIYFQNGQLILIYREQGIWEYCSDGNIELSGGITFSTENQLNELSLATSGVKIELLVQEDYFKTVNTIGANPNFETYIQRLGEHLGVIYNSYLEQ